MTGTPPTTFRDSWRFEFGCYGLTPPPVGPRQSANERIIIGQSLGPQTQYAGTRDPDMCMLLY